jgi:hypothetical protein
MIANFVFKSPNFLIFLNQIVATQLYVLFLFLSAFFRLFHSVLYLEFERVKIDGRMPHHPVMMLTTQ